MPRLNFSADDVQANRAGQMTSTQAKVLRRSLGHYEWRLLLLLTLFVLALLLFPQLTSNWVALGCVSLAILVVVAVLIQFQRALWLDARDGQVKEVAGKVWRVNLATRGSSYFAIHILVQSGEQSCIYGRSSDVRQFEEGLCYRIYYAPRSIVLLSAEEIPC